jgi:hypothetical protein
MITIALRESSNYTARPTRRSVKCSKAPDICTFGWALRSLPAPEKLFVDEHYGGVFIEILGARAVGRERGRNLVSPAGRYVTFQMADVAIPRAVFAELLQRIAALRLRSAPAPT